MKNSVYRERLEDFMEFCIDTNTTPNNFNWVMWSYVHGYLIQDMVMGVARFIATTLPVALKKYTGIDTSNS